MENKNINSQSIDLLTELEGLIDESKIDIQQTEEAIIIDALSEDLMQNDNLSE
jgi:hypothetical protein